MSIRLAASDYRRLTKILQELPDFANVRDRRRLLVSSLEGTPRAEVALARLDLDGMPMSVAGEVVSTLARFGQVSYGKEALGIFINYVEPYTKEEDADFIRELFQRYPLSGVNKPPRSIDRWVSTEDGNDNLEKIIGENTLRHVSFLQLALEAAKSVVHIRLKGKDGEGDELGTGFMISSRHLVTNNHVIPSRECAETAEYTFNYQLDSGGQPCETTKTTTVLNDFFYTNEELDYTVVSIRETAEVCPFLEG